MASSECGKSIKQCTFTQKYILADRVRGLEDEKNSETDGHKHAQHYEVISRNVCARIGNLSAGSRPEKTGQDVSEQQEQQKNACRYGYAPLLAETIHKRRVKQPVSVANEYEREQGSQSAVVALSGHTDVMLQIHCEFFSCDTPEQCRCKSEESTQNQCCDNHGQNYEARCYSVCRDTARGDAVHRTLRHIQTSAPENIFSHQLPRFALYPSSVSMATSLSLRSP